MKKQVIEQAEKLGKQRKTKSITLIALAVAFMAQSGLIAWFYFKPRFMPEKTEAAQEKEHVTSERSAQGAGEVKSILPLDPFLVNLADMSGSRYLRTTIRLGLNHELDEKEAAKRDVIISKIRDEIIDILTTKTAEDILKSNGKQELRKEILERLNRSVPEAGVVRVFIADLVVQL